MSTEFEQEKEKPLIPVYLRIVLTTVLALVAFGSLVTLFSYSLGIPSVQDPSGLGLNDLILFCLAGIIFINLPLEKMNIKIGSIEFKKQLEGQSEEQKRFNVELSERIDRIEEAISKPPTGVPLLDSPTQLAVETLERQEVTSEEKIKQDALRKTLTDFFNRYPRWYFNAPRIKEWGSTQEGFDIFNDYSAHQISLKLQQMLYDGDVKTKISKEGSTLYKLRW